MKHIFLIQHNDDYLNLKQYLWPILLAGAGFELYYPAYKHINIFIIININNTQDVVESHVRCPYKFKGGGSKFK